MGLQDLVRRSCVGLNRRLRLECDGVEVPLPPDAEGLVVLNIGCHMVRGGEGRQGRSRQGEGMSVWGCALPHGQGEGGGGGALSTVRGCVRRYVVPPDAVEGLVGPNKLPATAWWLRTCLPVASCPLSRQGNLNLPLGRRPTRTPSLARPAPV